MDQTDQLDRGRLLQFPGCDAFHHPGPGHWGLGLAFRARGTASKGYPAPSPPSWIVVGRTHLHILVRSLPGPPRESAARCLSVARGNHRTRAGVTDRPLGRISLRCEWRGLAGRSTRPNLFSYNCLQCLYILVRSPSTKTLVPSFLALMTH